MMSEAEQQAWLDRSPWVKDPWWRRVLAVLIP